MRHFFLSLPILLTQLPIFAQGSIQEQIEIWPGIGPGSDTLTITENTIERSLTGTCTRNWAMEKITVPTITPMIPDTSNGSAFLICPGGAYQRVVYDVEGIDIGNWLNSIGITAFILKYRLPANAHIDKINVPLQDAQRAIRYIKMHASEWNLDTSKIGIAGASAGGHVATTLATSYNKSCYELKDSTDSVSARPYYMFLLYPVVSMKTDITHTLTRSLLIGDNPTQELIDEFSAEKKVTSLSPKTFFAHANNDGSVSPENSKRLAQALTDSGVVAELKIYSDGKHGVGICKAVGTIFANWTKDCTNWLHNMGLTEKFIEPEIPDTTSSNISLPFKDDIVIYPNPATESFTIIAKNLTDNNIKLTITNAMGQNIWQSNFVELNGSLSKQIDAQNFPVGLYHIRISTGKTDHTKTLMIK